MLGQLIDTISGESRKEAETRARTAKRSGYYELLSRQEGLNRDLQKQQTLQKQMEAVVVIIGIAIGGYLLFRLLQTKKKQE